MIQINWKAIPFLAIGGLFAYANPESQEIASQGAGQFAMAFTGPLANAAAALVLAATILGGGGNVNLIGHPWISSGHRTTSGERTPPPCVSCFHRFSGVLLAIDQPMP